MANPLDDESSDSQKGNSSILIRSCSAVADMFQNMRTHLKWVAQQQTKNLPQCKDDPSDIVQGAMQKVVEHMDQFKGESKRQARAWLIRIVINQARDAVRRWSQAKRAYRREEHDSQMVRGLVDKNIETPSRIVAAEEDRQCVDFAIASLSIQDQQLIRWHDFHGMSFRQIGEKLNIPEATARHRYEKAFNRFSLAYKGRAA